MDRQTFRFKLGNFAASVRAKELHGLIDPRAVPCYILVAIKALCSGILLVALGFEIRPETWSVVGMWPFFIIGGMGLRAFGWARLGGTLEAVGIIYGQAFVSVFFIVALAALTGEWADNLLASWDSLLGFSWRTTVEATRSFLPVLELAYESFLWQPALLAVVLFWQKQEERAWLFATSVTVCLFLTAIIFVFFPARAAFVHYGITEFEGLSAPFSFIDPLEYIRNGGRIFSRDLINGMVTFPSFHAASSALFLWAAWSTFLRWPAVVINALLLVSTIPVGGHYFVDLLGGVALAALSLMAAKWMVKTAQVAAGRNSANPLESQFIGAA